VKYNSLSLPLSTFSSLLDRERISDFFRAIHRADNSDKGTSNHHESQWSSVWFWFCCVCVYAYVNMCMCMYCWTKKKIYREYILRRCRGRGLTVDRSLWVFLLLVDHPWVWCEWVRWHIWRDRGWLRVWVCHWLREFLHYALGDSCSKERKHMKQRGRERGRREWVRDKIMIFDARDRPWWTEMKMCENWL